MRALRAFAGFWYDFLVGDRPELFVGTLGVLAAARLLVVAGVAATLAGVLMAAAVVAVLAVSLGRAIFRH